MKLKSDCCEKYERKARACKRCPLMAALTKKQRRRRMRKVKKRLAKAA